MDVLFNKTMFVFLVVFAVILTVDYILGTIVAKRKKTYSSNKGNDGLIKKFIVFSLFSIVVLLLDFVDFFNLPSAQQYVDLMKVTLPATIIAYGRKELSSIVANLSLIFGFDVSDFLSKTLSADQELEAKKRKFDAEKITKLKIENSLKEIEEEEK